MRKWEVKVDVEVLSAKWYLKQEWQVRVEVEVEVLGGTWEVGNGSGRLKWGVGSGYWGYKWCKMEPWAWRVGQ